VSKLSSLVKPHIRELVPYQPGKPLAELERELGLAGSVKLASNESPVGPSPRVVEAIAKAAAGLNRYPEDSAPELRARLAERLEVEPGALVLAAGSDGVLELLGRVFLGPGDQALFPWPSFAMYPVVAQAQGARALQVPLDPELRIDVSAVLAGVTPDTRIVFLANPNNPTGTSIGAREFERLLRELPERIVLVCDEAYLEYVRREDFPDARAALRERPTLVVLRTLSKIYGLAGLRIGYGIGDPELISYLERARHPFIVNTLAQVAACAALEDREHVARVRELTHASLRQLERGFDRLGLTCPPSDANFLLVELGERAPELYERLLRRGVITRPMAGFGLPRHLRITAGLPEENERLLDALEAELRA
jgi:histidinol-phosphate aminotransferase